MKRVLTAIFCLLCCLCAAGQSSDFVKGLKFYKGGRIDAATECFEKELAANPDNDAASFYMGQAYLARSSRFNPDKAESYLARAVATDPGNYWYKYTLALFYSDTGRPEMATPLFEEIVRDFPGRVSSMMPVLADHYHAVGKDSVALEYYNKTLEMDPGNTPALYGRAHCRQALRDFEGYFSDINAFLATGGLAPGLKADYISKVASTQQMVIGFPAEVDSMVMAVWRMHPGDSLVSYATATHLFRTGRRQEAIAAMRSSLACNPDSYNVAYDYMIFLYSDHRWSEVAEAATVIWQRFPTHIETMRIRAFAFNNLKEYEAALEDFRTVYESAPKDSANIVSTLSAMANIHYTKGEFNKAFDCLKKVLKASPNDAGALNNYAWYLCEQNRRLKKAREMSSRAVKLEPDNPTYLDTYAWILHKLGQDVEAKAIFKQAMINGGKESRAVLEHYAAVLEALGENGLASIYRKQAARLPEPQQ